MAWYIICVYSYYTLSLYKVRFCSRLKLHACHKQRRSWQAYATFILNFQIMQRFFLFLYKFSSPCMITLIIDFAFSLYHFLKWFNELETAKWCKQYNHIIHLNFFFIFSALVLYVFFLFFFCAFLFSFCFSSIQ